MEVLQEIMENSPEEIQLQMQDNITWIKDAKKNKNGGWFSGKNPLCRCRGSCKKLRKAFNDAVNKGKIGAVVLGRDHHDVSGTDSPYRENL